MSIDKLSAAGTKGPRAIQMQMLTLVSVCVAVILLVHEHLMALQHEILLVAQPTSVSRIEKHAPPRPVFDFISVGSLNRQDYQEAQKRTFGSHPYVRHFFNITEHDDAESRCHEQLTTRDVMRISNFCREKKQWSPLSLMDKSRKWYGPRKWLRSKKNPAGWMCAQKRPIHGLSKVLKLYRQQLLELKASMDDIPSQQKQVLPDYLIIVDDDTYYQLDYIREELRHHNPETAEAIAGCLIRIKGSNVTFPFGGWGMILSRGSIANLMRPIYCQNSTGVQRDDFEENACRRLEDNHLEEKDLFREGMSVVDLMESYAVAEPLKQHAKWTRGFCLHSDWALAFFVELYNISRQSGSRQNVSLDAISPYMESEMYMWTQEIQGQCRHDSSMTCTKSSHICHYQSPQKMLELEGLTNGGIDAISQSEEDKRDVAEPS